MPVYGAAVPITEEFKVETVREYSFRVVKEKWGEIEAKHFDDLIQRESGWRADAQNPNSSAFGLPQFLNSTWETVGCVKTNDEKTQIHCAIKYIEKRYEKPSNAIAFHNKNNYY